MPRLETARAYRRFATPFVGELAQKRERRRRIEIVEACAIQHDGTVARNGQVPQCIPDAHETCQVLLCISRDSREAVDTITDQAIAAGGRETRPVQDMGLMYSRSFEDPDGHVWEPMWMDPAAAEQGAAAFENA